MQFPTDLQKRYELIMNKFRKISDDWKKYEDEIIPEDVDFAKEIVLFLIDALTYYEKNYENTKEEFWSEFVYRFPALFFYGPNGDDYSYLSFDEVELSEPFMQQWYKEDENPTLSDLQKFKEIVMEAYKKF